MSTPSLLNKSFHYTSAEESRKPGYLAAKFAKIRAQQQREMREQKADKVRPLRTAKR